MRERPPGSGNWQLRAYVDRDPITGKKRSIPRTLKGTEKAAAKALAVLVADAQRGNVAGTGVDVRTLAGRVGHKQVSMTLSRYGHFMPDRDRAAAGVLGKALTASEGG